MMVLLAGLWPALAFAAALGLGIGWVCGFPRGRAAPAALVSAASVVAGLAVGRIVPGLPGLWVEAAAGMLVLYLAGCTLGALAQAGRRGARTGNPGRPGTRPP